MSCGEDKLIAAVNPGYPPVRCKVCGYRWATIDDVPPRDFDVCPAVFYADHTGGTEAPAPKLSKEIAEDIEPELDKAPLTATTLSAANEKVTYEAVTVRQELTADDLKFLLENSELIQDEILSVGPDADAPLGPDSVVSFQVTLRVPTYHCIVCDRVVERGVVACSAHCGVIQVLKKEPI